MFRRRTFLFLALLILALEILLGNVEIGLVGRFLLPFFI